MKTPNDLTVTLERLSRVLQNEAHTGGLKPVQWEVLRYLANANRFSNSPSAVTAYLGITKGTVSQSLIALERKGLITKKPNRGDRRNVQLGLTGDGVNLLRSDPIDAAFESALELRPDALSALTDGLQLVLRAMLRQRGQNAFGQCKSCRFFQVNGPSGIKHFCRLLEEPLTVPDSEKICAEHQFSD